MTIMIDNMGLDSRFLVVYMVFHQYIVVAFMPIVRRLFHQCVDYLSDTETKMLLSKLCIEERHPKRLQKGMADSIEK